MSQVRTELHEVVAEMARLEKVGKHLEELRLEITEQNKQVDDFDHQLAEELKDFESIQGVSLKGLFHKVLGSKEEQIEKERQEYLKANLMYQEGKKALELLQYEESILSKKAAALPGVVEQYKTLLATREQELLTLGGEHAQRLRAIYSQIDKAQRLQQELTEAVTAVITAKKYANATMVHLNNAIRWGQWDMSNRRGWGYEQQKRSAIDRAAHEASRTNHALRQVQKELRDVGYEDNRLQLQLDLKQGFMSVFFDNLISDWVVQQRIATAKSHVQALHDRLHMVHQHLEQERGKAVQEIDSLQRAREDQLTA